LLGVRPLYASTSASFGISSPTFRVGWKSLALKPSNVLIGFYGFLITFKKLWYVLGISENESRSNRVWETKLSN
jgi:hypothetical protein